MSTSVTLKLKVSPSRRSQKFNFYSKILNKLVNNDVDFSEFKTESLSVPTVGEEIAATSSSCVRKSTYLRLSYAAWHVNIKKCSVLTFLVAIVLKRRVVDLRLWRRLIALRHLGSQS